MQNFAFCIAIRLEKHTNTFNFIKTVYCHWRIKSFRNNLRYLEQIVFCAKNSNMLNSFCDIRNLIHGWAGILVLYNLKRQH